MNKNPMKIPKKLQNLALSGLLASALPFNVNAQAEARNYAIPLLTISREVETIPERTYPVGPGPEGMSSEFDNYDIKQAGEAFKKIVEETEVLIKNYESAQRKAELEEMYNARLNATNKAQVQSKVQVSKNIVQRQVQRQTNTDWHSMLEKIVAKNEGGFRERRYYDINGIPHVAYGFNLTRAEGPEMFKDVGADFYKIKNGTGTLTKEQGDKLLRMDLAIFITGVRKKVKNFDNLPVPARIALVDIMYNVGSNRYDRFCKTPNSISNAAAKGKFKDAAKSVGRTALPNNRKPVLRDLFLQAANEYSNKSNQNPYGAQRNVYNSRR